MTQQVTREKLQSPVHQHMRTDFLQLRSDLTVAQTLDLILEKQAAGRIIYFYVTDGEGRLAGVVPTRRLLLSARDQLLSQIMVKPVISIPRTATLADACEFFILYQLLAFPVVDEQQRMIGLVDVELYTRELSDLDRIESHNDLFQLIGVNVMDAQQQSVFTLFRRRFPWLLATLAGGLLAAVVSDYFYEIASLAQVLPFIPLVLAIASSITSQSVSLALQSLRGRTPTRDALLQKIKFELAAGCLLGLACASIAGMAVFIWKGDLTVTFGLLASIVLSGAASAGMGLSMPYLIQTVNRNLQVAAGPLALASVDAVSLLLYFSIARLFVG